MFVIIPMKMDLSGTMGVVILGVIVGAVFGFVIICYSSIYGNTGSLVYSCISNKFVNEEGEKKNMSVH